MKWKYKIELSNEKVFEEIEKERGIIIPGMLKELIKETNASTPEKYNCIIGNTERVLGAILSFNKEDQDIDTVFTGLEVVKDKNLIPFAVDPFGNYFCLNTDNGEVLYWEHESQKTEGSGKTLNDFIASLH